MEGSLWLFRQKEVIIDQNVVWIQFQNFPRVIPMEILIGNLAAKKGCKFSEHLKSSIIFSQLTPPETCKTIGFSARRNQTLLNMVKSLMSFTKCHSIFEDYARFPLLN
jgi:hypothetical protein